MKILNRCSTQDHSPAIFATMRQYLKVDLLVFIFVIKPNFQRSIYSRTPPAAAFFVWLSASHSLSAFVRLEKVVSGVWRCLSKDQTCKCICGIRESDETPLLFEVYVMSSSSECICVIGESIWRVEEMSISHWERAVNHKDWEF